MKRILVFLLALTAVFPLGSAAFAQKAKAKVAATHKFSGTIAWVDPIQNAIVLKGSEDEVRFKVLPYTTIKRRGKVVVLAKFVRGDKVTVAYKVERRTKIATAIF